MPNPACFLVLAFAGVASFSLYAQSATPDQIPQLKEQLINAKPTEKAAICNELSFAWGRKNTDTSLYYASLALELASQSAQIKESLRAMNLRGDALMKKSYCDEARNTYQNALKAAKDAADQEMQARALHNLGKQAQTCPYNGSPLPYYEEAYQIREKIGDKAGLASTCLNLGVWYGDIDVDKSMFYNEKAMLLKEALGDRIGQATILANLAGQKLAKELWEEARVLLEKAVVINQEVGNEKGLAIIYGKLANCYMQQNNLPIAVTYHKKGIELFEKFNSPGDLAFALKNLNAAYIGMGRYDLAQDALLRAESLERDLNRPDLLAATWCAMGGLKLSMNEEQEAITWYKKALASPHLENQLQVGALYGISVSLDHLKNYPEALLYAKRNYDLAKKYDIKTEIAYALMGEATIFRHLNRLPEALAAIRQSIEIGEQNKIMQHLPEAYNIRSKIYLAMGGEKEVLALEDAQKSLLLAQKKNDLALTMLSWDQLSRAYQALGKTDEAVFYLRKAEALKDSLYSLPKVKAMTKKELTHEFDKERAIQKAEQEKKAALAALQLQGQRNMKWALVAGLFFLLGIGAFVITRLREQQRRRSEALRQKIASDLHDDVGSTLSSISILSESFVRNVEADLDKTRFGNIGEKARTALESISDIVWSVNPENDSMDKLLTRMSSYAAEILENVGTELLFQVGEDMEALSMPIEQRKDFYLIFKEAINNTAKYSGATQVWVKLSKSAQKITLEIKDNGKGFDFATVKNGNGLKNMVSRAERMNGKLHIDSAVEKGTVVRLRFIVP